MTITGSSGTRRYESAYGSSRPITAAEKLVEIICERLAMKQVTQLPARFWLLAEWKKQWHLQIVQANALLKLYDPETIFRALEENQRVYSLGAPFFRDSCEVKQTEIDSIRQGLEQAPAIPETNAAQPPRQGIKRGRSVRTIIGD